MRRIMMGLLGGILLLTACGQTVSAFPRTTISVSETNSVSKTAPAPLPSKTPRQPRNESTITITPLPTIPTFTPTFDVSTIVTVTPEPKAECPKENFSLKPDLKTLFAQEGLQTLNDGALLDFLNTGGTPQAVISDFIHKLEWFRSNMGIQQDVTGDGVDEFILTDSRVVFVFGCKNGEYQTWLSDTDEPMWLQSMRFNTSYDLNLNGIPEIIAEEEGGHGYPTMRVSIFEWNGSDFVSLIQGEMYNNNEYFPFADMPFFPSIVVWDIDGNGTLEVVLESNLPSPIHSQYAHLIPWRNETHVYSWNGTLFTLSQVEYTDAQFRFQASQDADREMLHGKYSKALSLYQDVIFNNELKIWSPSIEENEIAKVFAEDGLRLAPTSVPADPSEYHRLAAYAYYRIMLLHIVQGHESDAGTVYKTMQQKFGDDQYGQPYVEMATAFWGAYQSTHKMYNGCAAAIQYAAAHSEILTPLGSDYHGAQSHTYVPTDVCPFR